MVVYVCDNISEMISIYVNVKTIRYGYAFDSLIFKDGSVLNFHNMIYDINIADWKDLIWRKFLRLNV